MDIISCKVNDGTNERLRKMETTQEMWTHMQTIYEPQNDAQQAHTLQALLNYRMMDEQPVGQFLSEWCIPNGIRLISFWSVFSLNWVDLTLHYKIVLHFLLPEVEVRSIELRLISDEPIVEAISM